MTAEFLVRIVVMLLAVVFSIQGYARDYAEREDVKAFVKELATEESFSEAELLGYFHQAQYKQTVIDAISRPAEKTLTWSEYQDIFLTDRRRREGVSFARRHMDVLKAAYDLYGVPPAVVTAVIGVETSYGRLKGSYRVLDALATLSFDYPPRSEFFRKELKEFILLAREEEQKITDLKGSYAGAMGWGQFIPSSYRHYAVDFDADGVRDIWNNPVDAIGSVANYLHQHGWQRDGFIAVEVDGAGASEDIFNVSLEPTLTLEELRRPGISNIPPLASDELVSPMRLSGKRGQEYWLGGSNFYVITRYNHSKLYAMAVFQLSEDLRRATVGLAAE